MSHTTGPWKAIRIEGELTGSVFAGKKRICSGICDDVRLVKEAEANSALIEAAPDMLEALEWLSNEFDCRDDEYGMVGFTHDEFRKVEAAIRKARGEE